MILVEISADVGYNNIAQYIYKPTVYGVIGVIRTNHTICCDIEPSFTLRTLICTNFEPVYRSDASIDNGYVYCLSIPINLGYAFFKYLGHIRYQ